MTASAAYWLASATGRVYAPATAQVGSVGVISEMRNISGYLDKMGISITYIASGKWKTAGNPVEKLTPEQTAYFQERVDALHTVFKADVTQHMGISQDPAWTEAQILFAQPAQQLGLVTAIDVYKRQVLSRRLATYPCEHCGTVWDDGDRDRAVRRGEWRERTSGLEPVSYTHLDVYKRQPQARSFPATAS